MTNKNRKKKMEEQTPGEVKLKGYLDMIAPSVIQFYTDHYICGKEDLIYKALQVDVDREYRYCRKVEDSFLQTTGLMNPVIYMI